MTSESSLLRDGNRLIEYIDLELSTKEKTIIRDMPIEQKVAVLKLYAQLSPTIERTFILTLLS